MVRSRHCKPLELVLELEQQLAELGLGDQTIGLGQIDVVVELRGGRARVRCDCDGPDQAAGIPGNQHLRAVLAVHHHLVAGLNAAPLQAAGHAMDIVPELTVRPGLRIALVWMPVEEDLVGMLVHPLLEQGPDVLVAVLKLAGNCSRIGQVHVNLQASTGCSGRRLAAGLPVGSRGLRPVGVSRLHPGPGTSTDTSPAGPSLPIHPCLRRR